MYDDVYSPVNVSLENIHADSIQQQVSRTFTANGIYTVSPAQGYTAMNQAEITVNVDTTSELPILIDTFDWDGTHRYTTELDSSVGMNISMVTYSALLTINYETVSDLWNVNFFVYLGDDMRSTYIPGDTAYLYEEFGEFNYPLVVNFYVHNPLGDELVATLGYDSTDELVAASPVYEGAILNLPARLFSFRIIL